MTLRNFIARDGSSWTVWRIESSSARDVVGMPRAWLCFQGADEGTRRRLIDFPDNWDSLSDERLDLLCRIATPARSGERSSPPTGVSLVAEPAAIETGD